MAGGEQEELPLKNSPTRQGKANEKPEVPRTLATNMQQCCNNQSRPPHAVSTVTPSTPSAVRSEGLIEMRSSLISLRGVGFTHSSV